jgi:hypothetical protein
MKSHGMKHVDVQYKNRIPRKESERIGANIFVVCENNYLSAAKR